MPRSTTVWAAALVLASFSGSGPLLTTAEAMPAPGPRETPARPRYYFPRHIKRQIVTNTTAPAAPTTSATSSDSSSSSSSSQLESRKFDVTEALSQFFSESRSDSSSSSLLFSKSEADRPSPVTTTPDVPLTPVPISSSYQIPPLPGTGNQLPSSAPVLSKPNEEPPSSAPQSTLVGGRSSENIVSPSPPSTPTQQPKSEPQAAIPSSPVQAPSSAGLPSVILQPTPSSSPYSSSAPTQQPKSEPQEVVPSTPVQGPSSAGLPPVIIQPTPSPSPSLQPSREPAPVDSSTAARNPLDPVLGSTGLLPGIIVPASSAASSPSSASYSVVPGVSVQPTPSASAPAGGLVSSLSGGIGATGSFAISVVLPTPQPPAPVSSSRAIGSVGSVPEIVISPTSAPAATLQSSAPAASSFQGPFIIPGSTGGAIPSSVIQPTASQGLVGGLISSVLNVPAALPSSEVGSSGLLPSSGIVQPTPLPVASSRQQTLSIQPSSGGIVVGITTALGTSAPAPSASGPVVTSGAIPTSEAVRPSASLNLPSILSSLVSEVTGILPSGSAGPTAPGSPSPTPVPSAAPSVAPSPAPSAAPSGTLPPLVSSLVSDVTSLVSGVVSYTQVSVPPSIVSSLVSVLPTASVPVPLLSGSSIVSNIVSAISSGLIPSGALSTVSSGLNPTPSGVVPTPSNSASITPLLPSETPTITPSAASSRLTRPAASGTPSGILPSGISGSGVSSAPTVTPSPIQSSHVPASEVPASIASSVPGSSASAVPPSSGNATLSETPTFVLPTTTAGTPPASVSATPLPDVTSKPTPVQSQKPIGTDSATSMIVGTSIVQETTSNAQPSPTSSGIPSSLPKMIAPPEGVPTQYPANSFMGQVCFKWPLNYPFVSANDGGNQIFHYLPKAIADGLNISESEVRNIGLKPLDTTAYQGFITTLALFTIPSDLQGKLQAQLRNPADPFWHNQDSTVNDLTNLINTACPLPAGKLPGDGSNPNQPAGADPATTNTGGPGDGGALGGDINASRPVNASAAGIATGAIVGAIAYGAAMFFVARRYRNKRVAHQRSSSVPSTGSRMTYGSIPGGAAAWMHGARNGRITPGSRGSHGSDSSQGRSVRTQQISAPVMAENSLGWN